MIKKNTLNALRKICIRLNDHPIIWAVTGSLGMALQGMDIEVHDIDIQTSQSGAYEIEGYFPGYVVKPVQYVASERIRSHLGALEIEGVKVEIIGAIQKLVDGEAWEEPVNVEHYRRWISFEGEQVPVMSLEHEYHAYLRMGRVEKAEKIKNWLEEKRAKAV
jgi:hypothetical protein